MRKILLLKFINTSIILITSFILFKYGITLLHYSMNWVGNPELTFIENSKLFIYTYRNEYFIVGLALIIIGSYRFSEVK